MRKIEGPLKAIGFAGMVAAGISQAAAVPLLASMNQNSNAPLAGATEPAIPLSGSVNQTTNPTLSAPNSTASQMPTSLNTTANPAPGASQPANPPVAAVTQNTNRGFAPPLQGNANQATNLGSVPNQFPVAGTNQGFVETVLVTDGGLNTSGNASNVSNIPQVTISNVVTSNGPVTDTRLVNPWGLVVGPGVEWVSDNGSGLATVYGAAGLSFDNFDINVPGNTNLNRSGSNGLNTSETITQTNNLNFQATNNISFTGVRSLGAVPFNGRNIPGTKGGHGKPTGLVFNDTGQFVITNTVLTPATPAFGTNTFGRHGVRYGPATFLIATEGGAIAGWDYFVTGSNAVVAVDNSTNGAVYTGLAIAQLTNGAPMLYAANFHAGTVDVFNGNFQPVGSFTDTNLPAGYAPFNIKNISGELFVTFAQQGTNAYNALAGPGTGYVDVFAPDGTLLVSRFISQGALNAPWGMALSPFGFGPFGGALLIGNSGDGRINAYDLTTGKWLGHLTRPDGSDLVIDGLWSMGFASELSDLGGFGAGTEQLYFTAGANHGAGGVLGTITPNGSAGSSPTSNPTSLTP